MQLVDQPNVIGLASVFRRPPHNNEAEQALLGAILANNSAYHRVSEILLPEHFADAVHGRIYAAIATLIERGQVADPVSLKNLFDQDGALVEIGGAAYLARLATSVVTIINARNYAHTIHDLYLRRRLISIGEDAVNDAHAFDLDKPAGMMIEQLEARLYEIAESRETDGGLVAIGGSLDATLTKINESWKNRGKLMGATTGLIDVDKATGGLMGGELTILAGRPGMGKSTAAMTIALGAARAGIPVAFFSGEMSAEQLTQWALAEVTGISADRQRRGAISVAEIESLVGASIAVRDLPLHFDDTPGLSVPQIKARARRFKRKRGLGVIIVDHIGLLSASAEASRQGETAAITEITKHLKRLAKELNVPIVALSQLNRAVEARDEKRPGLADLRQSGSIEQDADVVIFVYRQEYYLKKAEPEQKAGESEEKFSKRKNEWHEAMDRCRGLAELVCAKNRSGPEFTVRCLFEPEHSRMANYSDRGDFR